MIFAVEHVRRIGPRFAQKKEIAVFDFVGAYAAKPFAPLARGFKLVICPGPKPCLNSRKGIARSIFTVMPYFSPCENQLAGPLITHMVQVSKWSPHVAAPDRLAAPMMQSRRAAERHGVRLSEPVDAVRKTGVNWRGAFFGARGAAMPTAKIVAIPIAYLFKRVLGAQPVNRSIIGLAAALAASPALAAQDYPTGLFENSPVVPSGPPDAAVPFGPPASGPPDSVGPLDDYCAGVAFRTFRSLAEVRQAHARCDSVHSAEPRSPSAEDQPDQ